jgi:DNA (cytosine-5)-methyltransferase 1
VGFELGITRAFNNEYAHISEKPEQEERTQGRERSTDKQEVLLHDRDRTAPLCIGYSEIDKYAIKVYEGQFRGHTNYGDATTINPKELPDFDLLVGGFPCQAFSVAGKRAGFDDTRGTLFFDIARILKEKRPRHLVLENVKGLLSHDSGKTFQTILGVLSDLGYFVEWQVLNSKDFGVPQNRERVFIVGHLGGEPRRKVFPIAGNGRKTDELPRHVSSTLTARYEGAQAVGTYVGESELNAQDDTSNRQDSGQEQTESDTNEQHGWQEATARIRRLTPTECERLQGFPDDWTAGESDTQRYKMCGNAVTVNVVQAVMERLI